VVIARPAARRERGSDGFDSIWRRGAAGQQQSGGGRGAEAGSDGPGHRVAYADGLLNVAGWAGSSFACLRHKEKNETKWETEFILLAHLFSLLSAQLLNEIWPHFTLQKYFI
jgi:hypothetical protein